MLRKVINGDAGGTRLVELDDGRLVFVGDDGFDVLGRLWGCEDRLLFLNVLEHFFFYIILDVVIFR